MNQPASFLGETLFVRLGQARWEQYRGMKRCIFLLCLALSLAHPGPAQDGPHREVRLIRRAFLDVTELLPSPEELDWYCRSGEPDDKAGGYAVQGRAALFIRHIAGSYSGIMGLPLYETWELLAPLLGQPAGDAAA